MNYPYSIRSIAEIYPDFANHPHIHGIPVFETYMPRMKREPR